MTWHHIPRPYNSKRGQEAQRDSFQDPKPKKVKTVFFQTDTADVMARAMIFDELDNHPSHPPSHSSLQWHYSPRSPSHSPPSAFPPRKSSVDPSSEESTPKGRERHKSEPAFIWPQDTDKRLTPWNFQHYYKKPHPWHHTKRRDQPKLKPEKLSAQCIEPFCASKLTHFKTLMWHNFTALQKLTPFKTPTVLQKLTPFKTPAVAYMAEILNRPLHWLLSRPFEEGKRTLKCKQLLLVFISRPHTGTRRHSTGQDTWTVHTSSVCSRSTSFCTYTLVTFKLLKSNTAFSQPQYK